MEISVFIIFASMEGCALVASVYLLVWFVFRTLFWRLVAGDFIVIFFVAATLSFLEQPGWPFGALSELVPCLE